MRLKQRTALITGGASGIGLATAERFISEGASVALLDRDSHALARERARLERESGRPVIGVEADVADKTAINRAVAAVAAVAAVSNALGRIDIVINAAGVNVFSDPLENR